MQQALDYSEDRILSEVHKYVWNTYPQFRRLCFHPNNEGLKTPMQASMDQAKGTVKGPADYICMIRNKEFSGLCMEAKLPEKTQSEEQKQFEERVKMEGFDYHLFFSVTEGIEIFERYLSKR